MSSKIIKLWLLAALLLLGAPAFANFSYEGYLTDSLGNIVVSQSAQIRLTIAHPVSASCILYVETHTVTTGTDGYFSVIVGAGTVNTGTFSDAFQNVSLPAGIVCYTPAAGDERNMKVEVNVPPAGWDVLGTMALHPVPAAMVTESVGGFPAGDILRVSGSSAFNAALNGTQATDLMNLINGSSAKYLAANAGTGASLPSYSGSPGAPVAGSVWFDSVGGTMKYYNGSVAVSLEAGAAGTVVNVATGTGLVGGPISSAGTISLANTAVTASTYGSPTQIPMFTVDAQGRLTAASNVTISGVAPGGVAGGDLTGTYPNPTLNTVSVAKGGTGLNALGTGNQILGVDAAGTAAEYKSLIAGTGVTIVSSPGQMTISAIGTGGTVTLVSSGNADIVVGTGTSTPVLTLNSGAAANQIVKLNGLAQLPAVDGRLLTNLSAANISLTVDKILNASAIYFDYKPNNAACANGQILQYVAGTGWTCGVQNPGTVISVSAGAPLNVSSGTSAPVITMDSGTSAGQALKWNGSSWAPAFVSMFDLRSTISGAQAFAGLGCLSNQTLTWTAATDNLSCTNILLSPAQIFGLAASATLDTTNANNITSGMINAARLPLSATYWATTGGGINFPGGNVGIGTTAPVATLDVNGFMRLKKNSTQPAACNSGTDGAMALTMGYGMCICDGTSSTWKEQSKFTSGGVCNWSCMHGTYMATANTSNWQVPNGCTEISVKAWGAGGGASVTTGTSGGGGGFASAQMTVTSGQFLSIAVGGGGGGTLSGAPGTTGGGAAGGTNSGGGGGYSGVFSGGTIGISGNAVIIAGGGGGAGNSTGANGGAAGGIAGLSGSETGSGAGATNISGGGGSGTGSAGAQFLGGNGGDINGGGGGGGWYGGGGGGYMTPGYGGGGGGGSYGAGSTFSFQTSSASGNSPAVTSSCGGGNTAMGGASGGSGTGGCVMISY